MRYLSICSGIEAATVAWRPLGWQPVAFAEIDPFPSAVLAHHYPEVPNLGDFTKITRGDLRSDVDLLVGGTPCQDFSVAGLRAGLDGERGNLSLEYLRLAQRLRPRWLVWENVPGVLSSLSHDAPDPSPPQIDLDGDDGPRDGQEIVVEDEYDADERHALACFLAGLSELGYGWAYRVLDAQYIRVDGYARAVPQRRRRVLVVGYLGDWRRAAAVLFERESLSGHPPPRREAGQGTAPTLSARTQGGGGLGTDFDCDGGLIAQTLNAGGHSRNPLDEPLVPLAFDTTQITSGENRCNPQPGDPCHPIPAHGHAPAIAFNTREDPEVAWDRAGSLGSSSPQSQGVMQGWRVRRLMPVECERLMGFPDGYTDIPYRGKPAADGPRYKALGNSKAVNVVRWVGQRIAMVEQIISAARAA